MQLSVLGLAQSQLPAVNKTPTPWTIGQLVQATVLQRLSASNVMVSIDGDKLLASTPANLAAGEQVLLRVSALGAQPLLQLVPMPSTAYPSEPRNGSVAVGYQSSPLPQLLNTLMWLTNDREPLVRTLPQAVRDLAADILSAVQTAEALIVPRNLQRAFWDAGLLLEARLAHISRGLPAMSEIDLDVKVHLLRLQSVLKQHLPRSVYDAVASGVARYSGPAARRSSSSPKPGRLGIPGTFLERLFTTIETVVHRLEARQLSAVASCAGQSFAWHVEIPFLCDGRVRTVELVIERYQSRSAPEQALGWTARLTLDADGLGIIHSKVTLMGQRIAVQLWAAHAATLASLTERMAALENGLARLGLSVMSIRCEQGMPADGAREGCCVIEAHA